MLARNIFFVLSALLVISIAEAAALVRKLPPPSRNTRQIVGGPSVITSEEGLKNVEDTIERHLGLLQDQENGVKLRLTKIKQARSQVVGGFRTEVDVELTSVSGDTTDCTINIWNLAGSPTEDSEIKCGEKSYKVSAQQQRSKRDAVGAPSEITSTEKLEQVKTRVRAGLTKLSEQDGGVKLELKELKKATEQIVAGTLYSIDAVLASPEETKTCTIKIVVQLWLDNEEIEVNCEDKTYKVTKSVTQV